MPTDTLQPAGISGFHSALANNTKSINNIIFGKKLNSAKDNPNKIAQSENKFVKW